MIFFIHLALIVFFLSNLFSAQSENTQVTTHPNTIATTAVGHGISNESLRYQVQEVNIACHTELHSHTGTIHYAIFINLKSCVETKNRAKIKDIKVLQF